MYMNRYMWVSIRKWYFSLKQIKIQWEHTGLLQRRYWREQRRAGDRAGSNLDKQQIRAYILPQSES